MSDLTYWLWLTTRKGLGPALVLALLDHFSTPERVYYGDREDFDSMPLPPHVKQSLLDKSLDGANRILGECDRLSIRITTFQDAAYPQRLRQIEVPPAVLYTKGRSFRFDEEAAIAIVGMRECTAAGRRRAERMAMDLAGKGALVVSGIAKGIDSCAVVGALKAGRPVVSVLAGGADVPTPRENRFLYEDVAAAGALISEYPPGTPHKGEHFNPRNRILSGLCLGVLAVECERRGGTMLTVNHALEQGREVYAFPIGMEEECARGTNWLIKTRRAKLVEQAEDILEDFSQFFPAKLTGRALPPGAAAARLSGWEDKPAPSAPSTPEAPTGAAPPAAKAAARKRLSRQEQRERFTDDQLAILQAAAEQALTADEIVEKTQIPMKRVLPAITMLQMDAAVEERPGRRFYALVELA